MLKKLCFWTVVLEKTLESPLDYKEVQPVHSKGDQPWDFFGRNDAKAETPMLWPPHAKSWLNGKDSDAGRDWGQEEKGRSEDAMAGWHHWLDGHESEWTPGVGDGQGGLACWDSWGRKVSDMTQWLIWSDLIWKFCLIYRNLENITEEREGEYHLKEWGLKLRSYHLVYQVFQMDCSLPRPWILRDTVEITWDKHTSVYCQSELCNKYLMCLIVTSKYLGLMLSIAVTNLWTWGLISSW